MSLSFRSIVAAIWVIAVACDGAASAGPLDDAFVATQRGDYATAIRIWLPLAEQGDVTAQSNLAKMYLTGQGTTQNYAEAVRWFRKAADLGDSGAQYNLGVLYRQGRGVKKSDVEASTWLRKSAGQGNADAQFALGAIYYVGQGARPNYAEALKWFRKAADQGNGDAQLNLGTMYSLGQGTQTDYRAAADWYQKAADQGVADAKTDLVALYARFPVLRAQSNDKTLAAPVQSQPVANQGGASAPIAMHSGWVTIENSEVTPDGFKIFRRYAYDEQDQTTPFVNLILFSCSKDVARAASHLTILLPKSYQPSSFSRDKWLPKTSVRFLIDGQVSVAVAGEYRNGEFYFDWNPDTNDQFDKIMRSNKLAMGFGDKNDIVEFQFVDAIDNVFSQFAPKLSPGVQITHYAKTGADGVMDACRAYQAVRAAQTRRPSDENPVRPANQTALAESSSQLTAADVRHIAGTHRDNEARFKRDFYGKIFSDVLAFKSANEVMFLKGKFIVSFNAAQSDNLDCRVMSEADIAEIANWNKGDKIKVEGIVSGVVMDSVILNECKFTK
jgi:TPR repeat protein